MRRIVAAVCLLLATAGLGVVAQRLLFGDEPVRPSGLVPRAPEPVPEPPPAPVALAARVEGATGDVVVYLASEGRWRPVALGEMLPADAVLRTQAGTVSLGIGDGIDVSVSRESQFRLGELSRRLSRVKLEGGRVTAMVEERDDTELVVQVLGSDAQARARAGDFSVMRSSGAQVTVASTRGAVDVSAAGANVLVGAGQQSVVPPGAAPRPAMKIPSELFITLSQGQAKKLTRRATTVAGATAPGSIITINGVATETRDGRFSARVPLKEGPNALEVVAVDALGRKALQRLDGLDVDSTPPRVQGTLKW